MAALMHKAAYGTMQERRHRHYDPILLTTYHRTDMVSMVQVHIPSLPIGAVWDNYGQPRDQAWIAAPQPAIAVGVQHWLRHITTGRWIGTQCKITAPPKRPDCLLHQSNT